MSGLSESTVESAALSWPANIGWRTAHGPDIAPDAPCAERADYSDVILAQRLRDALARFNPDLPTDALDDAFRKLTRPHGTTLETRNCASHRMAVDGVTVEYRDAGGVLRADQVCVIDFDDPANNDWLVVNQFTVVENKHERRPDIVLFVNGLRLVVVELKNPAGEPGDRRIGAVWHTQGSGKSLTMAFYAGRIVREPAMHNPTLVVLTDRNDLDDQLFSTFSRCRNLLRQPPTQAANRTDLRARLAVASGGVVFTTIQKFMPYGAAPSPKGRGGETGDRYPLLSERRNVVVIADEAHRSQYDFIDGYARHMRDALPNASFIGFTGTPIELADASTRAVFGDPISVYDIQRAVQDGATVPIYYESRLARLALDAPDRLARRVSGANNSGFRTTSLPSTMPWRPTPARCKCSVTRRCATSPANWWRRYATTSPSTGPCARTCGRICGGWSGASCASTATRRTSRKRRHGRCWSRRRHCPPAGRREASSAGGSGMD